MSALALVRYPSAEDEAAWRQLWALYNAFYEASVAEEVTARTWRRILDPAVPMFGRLAVVGRDVVGFSVNVIHEGTWTVAPICYLEDLFVDTAFRRQGIGRLLIQDLVDLATARGWSRLYWHTRKDNPGRGLYDEFVGADDFVRYRLIFPDKG